MNQLENIPDFTKANVLVVGDIMLDRYWHGGTSRISPEAPVPVVHVNKIEERLGGAANVALNMRTLGANAHLIGLSGNDEAADSLEDKLCAAAVSNVLVRDPNIPTTIKLRVISRNQQLIRIDFEDVTQIAPNNDQLISEYQKHLASSQAVVLSDYGKGAISDPQIIIKHAKQLGIPVLVDPKGRDFSRYRGATLLTPNRKEFETVVGLCNSEHELVVKGRQAIEDYDLQAILITRSEDGMTLLQRDQEELHLPAQVQEVFDVTGAGDTVIAVLASALAVGSNLSDAAKISNIAAGIVVSKMGAASVSTPELRRAIQHNIGNDRVMVKEEQLLQIIEDAKQHGEKIVFTNGCFDILHAGHVAYLKQAKSLGDRLIIAVNDDQSVTKLKGAGRPINSIDRRMAVLAALEDVDWVVPFSEDTPARLIAELKPDILVKGGDYKVSEIAGADTVLENGGEVKVLGFAKGCSTTSMIENIIEKTGVADTSA